MTHPTTITYKAPLGEVIIHHWQPVGIHHQQLALPSQTFKDGENISIAYHPDRFLMLYTAEAWQQILDKLNKLPAIGTTNGTAQLISQISTNTVNNQTLFIPACALSFAKIDNEAVWAVTSNHVQLWHPALFSEKVLAPQQLQ